MMAGPAMLQGGTMLQGRRDAAANAATLRAAAVSRQIFRAWLRRGVACAIGEDDLVFSFFTHKSRAVVWVMGSPRHVGGKATCPCGRKATCPVRFFF
jgi:hypothetical protein